MARYILLAGVFINYFGVEIVRNYISPPSYFNGFMQNRSIPENEYYAETITELILVFIVLFVASHFVFLPKRMKSEVLEQSDTANIILYIIYFLFVAYYLSTINTSFSNLDRGKGQFQVNALGSFKSIVILAIPYGIYILRTNLFGSKSRIMVGFLFLSIILHEISSGDRRLIGYVGVATLVFIYYYSNVKMSNLMVFGASFVLLFILSMTFRSVAESIVEKEALPFYKVFAKNLLTVNSDCAHLWWVKHYIEYDTGYLGFFNFVNHFIFLFIPTFVFQAITGNISYDRPVYLFNDLFNTSKNQGYDFMMTADFYWHFGFLGYFVYILFFIIGLKLFSKYIYSKDHALSVGVMFIVVYWVGGQRSDFGVFLKTTTYTVIFLYLINFIRNIR